jgi:hypothetical protein
LNTKEDTKFQKNKMVDIFNLSICPADSTGFGLCDIFTGVGVGAGNLAKTLIPVVIYAYVIIGSLMIIGGFLSKLVANVHIGNLKIK